MKKVTAAPAAKDAQSSVVSDGHATPEAHDRDTGAPDDAAADEAGFVYESHSAPVGTPTDEATPRTTVAEVVADETQNVEAVADGDGEVSASRSAVAEKAPVAGEKPKAKKGTVADRERTLDAGIRQRTYDLRKKDDEILSRRKELDDLDKQVKERQKTLGIEAKPAPDAKKPDAAAAPARPDYPNYKEFDTDEAYETAVGKWKTDMAAYEEGLIQTTEKRLTGTIDERFSEADRAAAVRASAAEFTGRVSAAKEKHGAEWTERAKALADLRSSWYSPDAHGEVSTPFLSDLARHHPDGPEFMFWLGEDVELAQLLADLEPSRAIRDGLMELPSLQPVMAYFGTAEGLEAFEELAVMRPAKAIQRLGVLYESLSAESSGPAKRPQSITAAKPPLSHRPGVGGAAPAAKGADVVPKGTSFESWMEEEDAVELKARQRALGLAS